MFLNIANKKIKGIGTEVLVWLVIFILLTFSNTAFDLLLSIEVSAVITTGMFILSIINRKLLLPKILLHKFMWFYFILSAIILSSIIFIFSKLEYNIIENYNESINMTKEWSPLDIALPSESKSFFEENEQDSNSRITISTELKISILFLCTYIVSIIYFFKIKEKKDEETHNLLLRERSEIELKFLKSQINPHFLFNALNNIYSMVYMGDRNAADCVLTLSEMLRYVTDNSGEKYVNLNSEVQYIENYIEFQRYRYENEINIQFNKKGDLNSFKISPMLLQPIVENSFKYSGIGSKKEAFIYISIVVSENMLSFIVENSKKKKNSQKSNRKGVGLENVKKRLDLLYSNNYNFYICDEEDIFKANLTINL